MVNTKTRLGLLALLVALGLGALTEAQAIPRLPELRPDKKKGFYAPVRAECPAGAAATDCPAPSAGRSDEEWQKLHHYCAELLRNNPAEARQAEGLCRQSGVVR